MLIVLDLRGFMLQSDNQSRGYETRIKNSGIQAVLARQGLAMDLRHCRYLKHLVDYPYC